MVKGAMKLAKEDKVLYKMLDSRQLGLKLIANVTYGYTAANFSGRMPCIEVSMRSGNSILHLKGENFQNISSREMSKDIPEPENKIPQFFSKLMINFEKVL